MSVFIDVRLAGLCLRLCQCFTREISVHLMFACEFVLRPCDCPCRHVNILCMFL